MGATLANNEQDAKRVPKGLGHELKSHLLIESDQVIKPKY